MKLALISDTHGHHGKLGVPPVDVLIHSGDFSNRGTLDEAAVFLQWFTKQPAKHLVLVAGNHDMFAEAHPAEFSRMIEAHKNIHYLHDSGVTIDGLKFWGSPFTPTFFDWGFMESRGPAIRKHWDKIPEDTDILITHGPPQGVGDMTPRGEAAGCLDLLARVMQIKPKLHVFGHIHEGRGEYGLGPTRFINAASISRYLHPPVVVEVE